MKRVHAYEAFHDDRRLFRTAREAREAEFDHLMWKISQHVGHSDGMVEMLRKLAHDLRGGVYPSAITVFLEAAEYLREYNAVMTGCILDPEEKDET